MRFGRGATRHRAQQPRIGLYTLELCTWNWYLPWSNWLDLVLWHGARVQEFSDSLGAETGKKTVCGRPRDKGGELFLDGPLQRMRCAKWLSGGNCFQTGFKGAKKATGKSLSVRFCDFVLSFLCIQVKLPNETKSLITEAEQVDELLGLELGWDPSKMLGDMGWAHQRT